MPHLTEDELLVLFELLVELLRRETEELLATALSWGRSGLDTVSPAVINGANQPTKSPSVRMNQLHTYFEPILRRERVKNRVVAVVMLIICALVFGWASAADLTERASARMVAGAFLASPVALFLLVWNFLPNRRLAALAEPSRIVWYYGVAKGGQVNAVMIGFDNGKLHRFPLPLISLKKGFSQEAFEHLRATAPGATTGFTEETRQAFKANPGALRR